MQNDTSKEDSRDFYPNWILQTNENAHLKGRISKVNLEPFNKNTGHLPALGVHSIFPGRGYVATLGNYKNKVLKTNSNNIIG